MNQMKKLSLLSFTLETVITSLEKRKKTIIN